MKSLEDIEKLKKLEFSLEEKWPKIIATVFQYARQNHSEEKSNLYIMVMPARRSPRDLKVCPKRPKWGIRKSFFSTKESLIIGAKCAERFWNLRHQHILRTSRTNMSQEQLWFSWSCFEAEGTVQITPWAPPRPLLKVSMSPSLPVPHSWHRQNGGNSVKHSELYWQKNHYFRFWIRW